MSVLDPITNDAIFETKASGDMAQSVANQSQHIVICGSCGAVEKQVGPRKTECPNCDDYIY